MSTQTLKIVRIGNSRGVRLPAAWLARYHMGETVIAEARPEGVVLHPVKDERLSWESTARAMASEIAASGEEFADLKVADADGLDHLDT